MFQMHCIHLITFEIHFFVIILDPLDINDHQLSTHTAAFCKFHGVLASIQRIRFRVDHIQFPLLSSPSSKLPSPRLPLSQPSQLHKASHHLCIPIIKVIQHMIIIITSPSPCVDKDAWLQPASVLQRP